MTNSLKSAAILSALLTSLMPAGAGAATKLEAPVKMLMKGHNRVAVLEAVARRDDGRVDFHAVETFYGEAEERVTLRMAEDVYRDVEEGATYVVALTNVRRNFRFRELREVDPEGFRVLAILGAGPALLEDTPQVRLLFTGRGAEPPATPEALFAAALATIGSDDPRTQAFAVLELRLRPEWHSLIDRDGARRIRALIADSGVAPAVRDRLLEIARELPAGLGKPWLAKECRRILRDLEPQFDLTTFYPRLATSAIEVLEERGRRSDGSVVARFLDSNNPGVVTAALRTLDRLDPALARQRARAVLEREDLHAESRRVLGEYLG